MEWMYKKRKMTGDLLSDWLASWWNLRVLRRVVIKIAINWHKETRRRVDVIEHFDHFAILDSVSRDDINRLPGMRKMKITDLYKHSVWCSDSLKGELCNSCRTKIRTNGKK